MTTDMPYCNGFGRIERSNTATVGTCYGCKVCRTRKRLDRERLCKLGNKLGKMGPK